MLEASWGLFWGNVGCIWRSHGAVGGLPAIAGRPVGAILEDVGQIRGVPSNIIAVLEPPNSFLRARWGRFGALAGPSMSFVGPLCSLSEASEAHERQNGDHVNFIWFAEVVGRFGMFCVYIGETPRLFGAVQGRSRRFLDVS